MLLMLLIIYCTATDCKNGETWTKDGIKFECRVDGLTTGFYPIACVAEGKEHKDGETWLQDYFKYECKQEGKEKMKFEIVACLTPKNKKEFGIGEKKIDENKKCDCNRDSSGKVKLRCDDVCTLDDGSELPINEKKSLGKILVQCQKSGNGLKLIEIGKEIFILVNILFRIPSKNFPENSISFDFSGKFSESKD